MLNNMILYREKIVKWGDKNYVDVRSYEVEKAIKRKKPIRVVVNDRYIDLDVKQLKKPYKKSDLMRSKYYPDQYYRLHSYEWTNTKSVNEGIDTNPSSFKYLK